MNMVDFDQKYDIHWVAQTEKKMQETMVVNCGPF
jgi:hypothetical protein